MKRETLSRRIASLLLALVMVLGMCMLTGCAEEEEVPYSSSVEVFDDVYVDIISIEPMTKIGVDENYTETACICYTATGEELWVYMKINKYMSSFDATADFEGDDWWADKVDFASPVRIHGEMRRAESLCEGLSIDIGSTLILYYESHE